MTQGFRTKALLEEKWSITKSGMSVSVDGSSIRIAQSPNGNERDEGEVAARMRLVASAPHGYKLSLMLSVIERRRQERNSSSPGFVSLSQAEWDVLLGVAWQALKVTLDV